MKAFLGSQDIWEIVVSGPTKRDHFVSNWEESIGTAGKEHQALSFNIKVWMIWSLRRWAMCPKWKKIRKFLKILSKLQARWKRCEFNYNINLNLFWIIAQGCRPMLIKWKGIEKISEMCELCFWEFKWFRYHGHRWAICSYTIRRRKFVEMEKLSLWRKPSKPRCIEIWWRRGDKGQRDVDVDEEGDVVMTKKEEEETNMIASTIKRQAITELGSIEEGWLKEEATIIEQIRGGMPSLILDISIVINLNIWKLWLRMSLWY